MGDEDDRTAQKNDTPSLNKDSGNRTASHVTSIKGPESLFERLQDFVRQVPLCLLGRSSNTYDVRIKALLRACD